MEAMGSVHVRMRPAGSTAQNDVHLTVANVILEKAIIYVILSPHEGPWPFIIENESDYEVTIGQTVSGKLSMDRILNLVFRMTFVSS